MECTTSGRFINAILFFLVTIFFDSVTPWGTRLEATNYISGWIKMKSNDNSLSEASWNHNLNDIPVRVDIQVKPASGPDTGYYFPGVAAAQREGVVQSPYGGIVYKYNSTTVKLFAPNKINGNSPGYAIFTGGDVWNGPKPQQESDVLVRVRVWGEKHFPKPCFSTKWEHLSVPGRGFQTVEHKCGKQPQFVVVQIKLGTTDYIADGIGYLMTINSRQQYNKFGGVLYGYDSKNISIWPNYAFGTLFIITDGWGTSKEEYKSGFYRILAWESLKELRKENKHIHIPTKNSNEISLQDSVDQAYDIVQVMIKELSAGGANNGYLFKATGAVQNVQNSSYGGVVYSYSSNSVRVWYPPVQNQTTAKNDNKQFLVYIHKMYGGNTHNSVAEDGELDISIFKPYKTFITTTKPTTKLTTATTTLSTTTSLTTTSGIPTTNTVSSTIKKQSSIKKGTVTKDITRTKADCDYDIWPWIAIGFCSCLIIVLVTGLIWHFIKRRSKHEVGCQRKPNQKDDIGAAENMQSSPPRHEAWKLDFV